MFLHTMVLIERFILETMLEFHYEEASDSSAMLPTPLGIKYQYRWHGILMFPHIDALR